MSDKVIAVPVETADDVFALRHSGRIAAAAFGLDERVQVRLATALSELGREGLALGARVSAVFKRADDGGLEVTIDGFSPEDLERAHLGLDAARKLVDDVEVERDDAGVTITVFMRPRGKKKPTLSQIRAALKRDVPPRPLDELRLQNRDLVATLTEVKAQSEQLAQLNAELEETNRGVMAMYGQLAGELEETNRGVVALYAELDDKTVQLNEASEAKTRFLANVSHELRSPVSSIIALTKLMLEPANKIDEERLQQLRLVSRSAGELLVLVNDLLDLAKAESGRLEPTVSPVDLAEVASDLRGTLRPLTRPGVELHVEVDAVPPIETDRVLLTHVLRNLLVNAVKYTVKGSVTLSVRQNAAHEVDLIVADTGIGIAPEDRSRVFEEFYQVRGALQADRKGTGLGLPYARRVTETLGGRLTLESEVGRGSTFTVNLPTTWQPLLMGKSPGRRTTAAVHAGTVLIVDDDDSFRTALRGMLQGLAGEVLEAQNGTTGLAMMRSARPDVAFLDLRMPDLDGSEVLAQMTADPELRGIRVVIVTSADLTASAKITLGAATAILAKSNVDRNAVAAVLDEALSAAKSSG